MVTKKKKVRKNPVASILTGKFLKLKSQVLLTKLGPFRKCIFAGKGATRFFLICEYFKFHINWIRFNATVPNKD